MRAGRRTRVVLPFALLAALIGTTLLVHGLAQPDPSDPGYLSPVSDDDVGGARLAAALQARGVTVERRTGITEALDAVRAEPPATLFVPAPEFVDLGAIASVTGLPGGTRLVVAAPDGDALEQTVWPVAHGRTRWAADAPDPGCADPVAAAAGPAAVLRHAYAAGDAPVCYAGGLVTFADGALTVTLAGAADPFRNDRIGEHGNAALATGLLAGTSRVVWLDVHRADAVAEPTPEETEPGGPPTEPEERPEAPGDGPASGEPGTGSEDDASAPEPEDDVLSEVFPAAVWATLLLAAIALLALAAAAARRLGAPVAEPLPSRVPADETMLGHAGLYQRVRARGPTLDVLRDAARRRLAAHFGLPADAGPAELARHAGLPAEHVRAVLAGDQPRSDADLVAAAAAVQNLVHQILHRPTEGDPS